MSDESKVLLDIAMLAQVEGQKTKATKLRDVAKYIEDLELANLALDRRILDLEDGCCRHHCTTKSVMWKAGFRWAFSLSKKGLSSANQETQYDKWRKLHDR